MRRRLLALSVLAYPREQREQDGDYLQDLAEELAGRHGVLRELGSLLRNGIVERVRLRRGPHRAGRSTWLPRAVVACLAATGLTAVVLSLPALGADRRVETEEFSCSATGGCAEAAALVAARRRDGWTCSSASAVSWRCAWGGAR